MSTLLDIVRSGAALVVLVLHGVQAGLYTGPWPAMPMAQHYAVVVFFVLSGLVITTSVQGRPATLRGFAIARAARILPVSLAALAFATAAFLLATGLGHSPLHFDSYGVLNWRGTITPLLFLNESPFGAGPVWNPPYWSLSYEVWYYALFAVACFLRGVKRIVWLIIMGLLAGPKVLLLLPVWLVGVWLARSKWLRRADLCSGFSLLICGLGLAAGQTALVAPGADALRMLAEAVRAEEWAGPLGFSKFLFSDLALALAVAMIFTGLRPLLHRWPHMLQPIARPAQILAGFSFTLYLFHWPLLNLCTTFKLKAGDSLPGFLALLLSMIAICYAISLATEQQRGRVRSWMQRLWPSPLAFRAPAP